MTDQKPCPLCEAEVASQRTQWLDFYECPRCGDFAVNHNAERMLKGFEAKHLLSGIVREAHEIGERIEFTRDNIAMLASSAPGQADVATKAQKLLRAMARRSDWPGQRVDISGGVDYPLCFAANVEEFDYYLQYLEVQGLIERRSNSSTGGTWFILTPEGWAEAQRKRIGPSDKAFVAMSFDPSATDLSAAFTMAIKPALEDTGYRAVRVDQEQFNDSIDDKIRAEIRESRFVVADVTQHKNGVYFEAGFGLGLGLPVLWLCRDDDKGKMHFDTRQLNHIIWKPNELDVLAERLATRVRATIGRGPYKPKI